MSKQQRDHLKGTLTSIASTLSSAEHTLAKMPLRVDIPNEDLHDENLYDAVTYADAALVALIALDDEITALLLDRDIVYAMKDLDMKRKLRQQIRSRQP